MNRPTLPTLPARSVLVDTAQQAEARYRASIHERRLLGARYGWDSAEYERAVDRALTLQRDAAAARMAADHALDRHATSPAPYCPDCVR